MKPPKGLRLPDGYVLKLHRTLQGMKQAAHNFHYHKVDKLLTEYGLSSGVFLTHHGRIWIFQGLWLLWKSYKSL